MPYQITRLKNGKYQVKVKDTEKIHAKGTTKTKKQKTKKINKYGADG